MIISFIRGIKDGLRHSQGKSLQYNEIYGISQPDRIEVDNQYIIDALESEILMIEVVIKRDNERALILEKQLTKASPKQSEVIYNKLNTLDKQTFKHYKRIDQLKEQIKELSG